MEIKLLFQGTHPHRYGQNPLEKAFAEAWQKINDTSQPGLPTSTLAYLLSNDQHYTPEPTSSDHCVAATVIQWLGSPVGQNFVRDVMKEGIE